MKGKKKQKVVKGWAVIDARSNELIEPWTGETLGQSMAKIRSASHNHILGIKTKVVPCKIILNLPLK